MANSATETSSPGTSIQVDWNDIVRFIRQLSHDLRNHLNAMELQAALLSELVTDSELLGEVKRLRQMISETGNGLQKLSAKFAQVKPSLIRYKTDELIDDLRQKLNTDFPQLSAKIEWQLEGVSGEVEIDPQLVQQAVFELFINAAQHQPADSLRVTSGVESGMLVFTLEEPKNRFELTTENWGREPLRSMQRDHYGLGLNRARTIIEAHGGELRARFDSSESKLITTVVLPLVRRES